MSAGGESHSAEDVNNDLEISEKYVIKRLLVERKSWQDHVKYVGRALFLANPSVIPTKPQRRSGGQTSRGLRRKRQRVFGIFGSVRDAFVPGRWSKPFNKSSSQGLTTQGLTAQALTTEETSFIPDIFFIIDSRWSISRIERESLIRAFLSAEVVTSALEILPPD